MVAASAAAALAVPACGTSSVIDPVAKAATVSNSVPGFRADIVMQMGSSALPSAITATGSGSFDVRDHAGAMDLAMQLPNSPQITQALGSTTLQLQERIRQLTIYMRMPAALTAKLPGGKPWWKLNLAQAAAAQGMSGLSSLATNPAGGDPSQFLQYMRAAGQVTKVGTAQVSGYQTTHYHVLVDLDKVAARMPANQQTAVRQTIQKLESMIHSKQLPVDVWIDTNNLIRRMQMNMNISLPTGQSMSVNMQMTIPRYGVQPLPPVPPADQVMDLTSLASHGSSSSSSGTATAPKGTLGTATQPGY